MRDKVKTTIDMVPVEIEFVSIGPSSQHLIDSMKENLAKEAIVEPFEPVKVVDSQLKSPQNPEKLSKKEIHMENKNSIVTKDNVTNTSDTATHIIEDIEEIGQVIQTSTEEKPWWTSRIIVGNLAFIVTALLATFGFNIVISEEMITIIVAIVGVINIYLRKDTNSTISKQVVPDYLRFSK